MHFTEILQRYLFRNFEVLVGSPPKPGGEGHGRRRSGGRSAGRGPRPRGGNPRVRGKGYGPREKSQLLEDYRHHRPPNSGFLPQWLRIREWRKEVKNGGGGKKKGEERKM